MKTEGLFKVAAFDHGKLNVSTQRAAGTAQQTLYKPSKSNVAVNDDDVLTFTIIPKKGLTFIPKSLSFNASRWGTIGGKFDVVATAKGTETTPAAGINPNTAIAVCSQPAVTTCRKSPLPTRPDWSSKSRPTTLPTTRSTDWQHRRHRRRGGCARRPYLPTP